MPIKFAAQTIPYVCQFASPDMVADFVHERLAVHSDPRWAEYGAQSPDEYAHWALRSCGVVCVKMVADGLTEQDSQPVMGWVQAGLAIDGYLTEIRPDRPERPVEKGWKHAALTQLLNGAGLQASMEANIRTSTLVEHIEQGQVVIASVTSQLGDDSPITRQSGHLVVVYGFEMDSKGDPTHIIVHNPSGRSPDYQAGARIPITRFDEGFSGRGIVVAQPPITSGS